MKYLLITFLLLFIHSFIRPAQPTEIFYAIKNNKSFEEIEALLQKKENYRLGPEYIDSLSRKEKEFQKIFKKNDHKALYKFLEQYRSSKVLYLTTLFRIKYHVECIYNSIDTYKGQYPNYRSFQEKSELKEVIKRFNSIIPPQLKIILENTEIKTQKIFDLIIKIIDEEIIGFINSNAHLMTHEDAVYLFNECLNKRNIHILKILIKKFKLKETTVAINMNTLRDAAFKCIEQENRYKCLKVLMEFGVKDTTDYPTILYELARIGNVKELKLALKHGFDPNFIVETSSIYNTAICIAVSNGHFECVETLIEYGANIKENLKERATFVKAKDNLKNKRRALLINFILPDLANIVLEYAIDDK